MTLDELGRHYRTDKSSRVHGYLPAYDALFAPLRQSEISLLEIGVKGGASLKVWRDYFPKARIIGVDIKPDAREFEGGRIAIEIADQGNAQALGAIAARHGPFDIVVEDGSHRWRHQILAIKQLIPALKPGGMFVSEDLHVGFPPLAERYAHGEQRSAFDILRELAELVMRARDAVQPNVVDPDLPALVTLLSSVTFLRRACVLRRQA